MSAAPITTARAGTLRPALSNRDYSSDSRHRTQGRTRPTDGSLLIHITSAAHDVSYVCTDNFVRALSAGCNSTPVRRSQRFKILDTKRLHPMEKLANRKIWPFLAVAVWCVGFVTLQLQNTDGANFLFWVVAPEVIGWGVAIAIIGSAFLAWLPFALLSEGFKNRHNKQHVRLLIGFAVFALEGILLCYLFNALQIPNMYGYIIGLAYYFGFFFLWNNIFGT